MSFWKRTGAIFLALFLTLSLFAPQTARADAATDKSVTDAARWIAKQYAEDENFYGVADAVIALSAANKEPDTVRAMLVDLKASAPEYVEGNPGGLAKIIMAADIAGQNPRTFLGADRDLVAELQALIETESGKRDAKLYFAPAIITIALSRTGQAVPAWLTEALLATQQDGGFGYSMGGTFYPDPDYTALGLSAVNLLSTNPNASADDKSKASDSLAAAQQWAADAKNQKTDGTNYYWETYSSPNSTGMLSSALKEVGVEVESPVRYLVSQQQADGGWAASHNGKRSNVMSTTQAILGVIGKGYATAGSTQVPDLLDELKPVFVTQPAPSTVVTGSKVTFTVDITSDSDTTIAWEKDVDGVWTTIAGATSNVLTLDTVDVGSDGLRVRAVATNKDGSTVSDVAELTVTAAEPNTPEAPNTPDTPTVPAKPGASDGTGNPAKPVKPSVNPKLPNTGV